MVRIACFSYWIESYWGGAVAALGGALLLGALPRPMRSGRFKDSILLGAGMAILANTRPFEGGALILAVAGTLAVWMFRDRSLIRKLVPAAALVCCAGAAMLYYNWRITGDSLALPYSVNRAQYAVAQVFYLAAPTSGAVLSPQGDARFLHGLGADRLQYFTRLEWL